MSETKGIDHEDTIAPVCPYCGYTHFDMWDMDDYDDYVCDDCEEKFYLRRDIEITYCTSKRDDL